MRRYNLRHAGDERKWLVVDGTTALPAKLDGAPLTALGWAEACDMVALLNCLDAIESAARDYEALAAAE